MLNATQSYRQAQVNTVGRADITLMLYDGLLRFLDLAAEKMEEKKIQEKGNYISRALDIINELDSTLNMEKGGEVSKGLHQLYIITNKNLLMANLKNDLSILKSVRENMQVVRDSFFEAMQTEEAKAMLLKMGPVPVSSSGGGQINLGGSIQERANSIKEAQQKVEAIKRAKAQLENAQTEEEKMLAQKELESLLGKSVLSPQKPVPVSMAQKASRAFLQQQGGFQPQQTPLTAQSQTVQKGAGQHPVMQLKSHGHLVHQEEVSGRTQQTAEQSTLYRQGALLGQKTMQNMANAYGSHSAQASLQTIGQVAGRTRVLSTAVEQNGNGSFVESENKTAQSSLGTLETPAGTGQMSGLLSKKMLLYKNS